MSIKSYFKVVDAPLAIVVGGVAAVLIALQLGAVGWLAQAQVERAKERDSSQRETRMARAQCLNVQGAEAFAACSESYRSAGRSDAGVDTVAVR